MRSREQGSQSRHWESGSVSFSQSRHSFSGLVRDGPLGEFSLDLVGEVAKSWDALCPREFPEEGFCAIEGNDIGDGGPIQLSVSGVDSVVARYAVVVILLSATLEYAASAGVARAGLVEVRVVKVGFRVGGRRRGSERECGLLWLLLGAGEWDAFHELRIEFVGGQDAVECFFVGFQAIVLAFSV